MAGMPFRNAFRAGVGKDIICRLSYSLVSARDLGSIRGLILFKGSMYGWVE